MDAVIDVCYDSGVQSISRVNGDVGHDVDEDMLLYIMIIWEDEP